MHREFNKINDTTIDFKYSSVEGIYSLDEITEEEKYVYDMFFHDTSKSDGGFYYSVLVTGNELSDFTLPSSYALFDKKILTYLIFNKKKELLKKALELNAFVYKEGPIKDVIEQIKKDIIDHKVDFDSINDKVQFYKKTKIELFQKEKSL